MREGYVQMRNETQTAVAVGSDNNSGLTAYLSSRMRHLFRLDVFVKLLARQEAQLNRRLAQADPLFVRVLGDLGGVVVADVRVQSGDEHKRLAQMFVALRAVEFDAGDAVIDEAVTGIF